MRKRNCRVEIYFTKTELETLTKKVRKSGLSREGYCRRILNGAVVKEAPPAELPLLIREVRRVGYNIDQLLKRANSIGLLDVPQMRKVLENVDTAAKTVISAYGDT